MVKRRIQKNCRWLTAVVNDQPYHHLGFVSGIRNGQAPSLVLTQLTATQVIVAEVWEECDAQSVITKSNQVVTPIDGTAICKTREEINN